MGRRRRKSAKSNQVTGVFVLIGVACVFLYNFVATYFVEIASIAGGLGAIWLATRIFRPSVNDDVAAPDSFVSTEPFRPQLMLTKQTGPDPDPDPTIRITPIVDAARAEERPFRTSFENAYAEPKVANARWVRPGEAVVIQGVEISSGWFYLGSDRGSGYAGIKHCLLDPNLTISISRARSPGNPPAEFSYASLNKTHRRAFLEWMADGRRDPNVEPAYVGIFVSGLEYRVFLERQRSEIVELCQEVERILDLCDGRASVFWHASKFLSYASALLSPPRRPDARFAKIGGQFSPDEFSPHVRAFIGDKLAKGEPITGDDALVWAVALPNVWLRTPATRCWEEFKALWSIRFADKYRSGFVVPMPKTRIKAVYQAYLGAFRVPLVGTIEALPDISSDVRTAPKLKELVEACTNELDSYSRLLGRQPGLTGQPRASLLLPEDLWAGRYERCVQEMAAELGDDSTRVAKLGAVMAAADFPLEDVTAKEWVSSVDRFSAALRCRGIGIEPDGSRAGSVLAAETTICLFRLDGDATPTDSDPTAWRTAIDFAVLALAAAGPVSESVRVAAASAVVANLAEIEPMRIEAYALVSEPIAGRLSKTFKSVGELPLDERQFMARCSVAAVLASGAAQPATVRIMERLYTALRFSTADLYSALHSGDSDRAVTPLSSTAAEIGLDAVTRELAGGAGSPPPITQDAVVIDMDKLARARESTHAVSKILAEVFTEEQTVATAPPVPMSEAAAGNAVQSPLRGLDTAHAELLSTLIDEGSLSRSDFETRARRLKLLADGAIEHINDWAFDQFDEPLIEDGDVVTIAGHLRSQIDDMRGKQQ